MFLDNYRIDWEEQKVKVCCDILDHLRVPVSTEDRANKRKGFVPYYGANGQQGTIDGYIFDENLILIAEDGGDFDNYATKPIAYRISGKSWVNNHAHVLRARAGFDQSFIFHALAHKDIRFFIRGGTRSKLNKGELVEISISVPKRESEQRAIAGILDTVDDAICQTQSLIQNLRLVRVGMLNDLLTLGLDENSELRDPVRHPEQFKDSSLGRIPKQWEVVPLSHLCKDGLSNGLFKDRKRIGGEMPLINVSDLYGSFGVNLANVERIHVEPEETKRYSAQKGDVFFTRSSLNLTGIAECNVLRVDDSQAVFECHLMRLRPNCDLAWGEYLAHWCRSAFARSFFM
ncbi:MAG: restriction endonuclease subunit S [Syntrophobacteraceae bacterium]